MRAKKGTGLWLLDILQTHSDFGVIDHIHLQAKYGKYEQAANENNKAENYHISFRMALNSAVKYGFIEKIKSKKNEPKYPLKYQVKQQYKIMRVVPEHELMDPEKYYQFIAWGGRSA